MFPFQLELKTSRKTQSHFFLWSNNHITLYFITNTIWKNLVVFWMVINTQIQDTINSFFYGQARTYLTNVSKIVKKKHTGTSTGRVGSNHTPDLHRSSARTSATGNSTVSGSRAFTGTPRSRQNRPSVLSLVPISSLRPRHWTCDQDKYKINGWNRKERRHRHYMLALSRSWS